MDHFTIQLALTAVSLIGLNNGSIGADIRNCVNELAVVISEAMDKVGRPTYLTESKVTRASLENLPVIVLAYFWTV